MEQITTALAIDASVITRVAEQYKISNVDNDLAASYYTLKLVIWMLIWFCIILGFIWTVDPYGVSPIQINLSGININKPKRLDIDRLIKPYEVWRYQPKTIFMGTSRIHQSMDPIVFNNTKFAPAYNASIPASNLNQNAAYLEEYFMLDKKLQYVFIELFLYNFIIPQQELKKITWKEFFKITIPLFFSTDAALDAVYTIDFNQSGSAIGPYISPGGNWIRPKGFNTKDTFNRDLYINNIIKAHLSISDMIVQPSAIDSLNQIIEICKKHDAKLYMIITPNYPWDDYRLMSLGYWSLLEDWLKKMGTYNNVFSFSQYNMLLEERPGEKMQWWNDPIHFSDNMGHLIQLLFLGVHSPEIPNNLMRPINSNNFMTIIQERDSGLNHWIDKNQDFVMAFDEAKTKAGNVARRAI